MVEKGLNTSILRITQLTRQRQLLPSSNLRKICITCALSKTKSSYINHARMNAFTLLSQLIILDYCLSSNLVYESKQKDLAFGSSKIKGIKNLPLQSLLQWTVAIRVKF